MAERTFPGLIRFAGKPRYGYRIAEKEVKLDTVMVRGPAHEVTRMAPAKTVFIEPEELHATFTDLWVPRKLNSMEER